MWNMKSVFAFHRGLKKKEKKKEDAKENNFRKKKGVNVSSSNSICQKIWQSSFPYVLSYMALNRYYISILFR